MPGAAATALPLPTFFEVSAPAHWRAIDFISDLHLCDSMPRTFGAWAEHMDTTRSDAVFILGDLFEVWVGDDSRSRAFERQCLEVMARAATRLQLAVMVGNRDFLLGAAMLRDCGAMGLPDPTVLTAWGQRILLSHGDALCTDDVPYQAFRREVRSADWQNAFLARPLDERIKAATQMRRASQARHHLDGNRDADVDAGHAVQWMHACGVAELVHGHTHRPGSNALAPGFKRHVLSDWDLDGARRAEVLRLTRDGLARLPPSRTHAATDTPTP
jgi:UDP-2,3-diacylglucosamine hydrolase